MNRNLWIILTVLVILIGGYVLITRSNNSSPTITPTPTPISQVSSTPEATASPTLTEKETNINMSNFSFVPSTVTITKGTKVTWTNNDSVRHDAMSDPGREMFKSQLLEQGQSYSFTFTDAGTFDYFCSVHLNMKGGITVTE